MTGSGDRESGKSDLPDRAARILADDLAALRAVTGKDLPPLAPFAPSTDGARARTRDAGPGGILMNALRKTTTRPWMITALGTVAVALVLVFIPISYERLVGSELTLRVGGAPPAPGTIRDLASDLRTRLGAEKIRVEADAASGVTLTADIPDASWRRVTKLAVDYARGLAGRGIQATPRVRPRFEKVHGNVYAAIGSLVEIRIQTEGKSDSQIADEIRSQLLAAGLSDATVEVNRQDGQTQIRIEAQKTSDGEGAPETECPEFRVTLDGQEPGAPNVQKCEVKVKRTEGMTDQQVIDEVKSQLAAQGVHDAEVSFENGKIHIQRAGE